MLMFCASYCYLNQFFEVGISFKTVHIVSQCLVTESIHLLHSGWMYGDYFILKDIIYKACTHVYLN